MNVQPAVWCLGEWPFSRPAQARQCPLSTNNSSPGTRSNIISLSKKVSVVPRELLEETWVSSQMQMSSKMAHRLRLLLFALCSFQTRPYCLSLATAVRRYLCCCIGLRAIGVRYCRVNGTYGAYMYCFKTKALNRDAKIRKWKKAIHNIPLFTVIWGAPTQTNLL